MNEIERLQAEIAERQEQLIKLQSSTVCGVLALKLKKLRKEAGLTQTQVSSVLKITTSGYAFHEHGERSMSPDQLVAIADFYDVSVDWLLGRTDKKDFTEAEQ